MSAEQTVRQSQEIYTEILYWGLLAIRNSNDLKYSQALANHLHNLPNLIHRLDHDGLHDYYWRVERANFLNSVTPEQANVFDSLWHELEAARKIESKHRQPHNLLKP